MKIKTIKVSTRTDTGKGPARRKRTAGDIPAVVYGEGSQAVSLVINAKEFHALVHGEQGEHAIVHLDVEDKPELSGPSMVKAVQHHPIKEHVMHADFQRIKLDQPIRTLVPINVVGHCIGIVEGGVPDQQLRELEVECLPLDTPDQFDVDITDLHIGGRLHVSDLIAAENTTIVTEGDRTIIAIHAPRVAGKGKEADAADADADVVAEAEESD